MSEAKLITISMDEYKRLERLQARVAELEAILGRVRNEIRTADLMIAGLDLEIDAALEGKKMSASRADYWRDKIHHFRFDDRFHLGLGDVRLTCGDGDDIVSDLYSAEAERDQLRARVAELEGALDRIALRGYDVQREEHRIARAALEGK